MSINVTSSHSGAAPFAGTWETQMYGYVSTDSNLNGQLGIISSNLLLGYPIEAVGLTYPLGAASFILLLGSAAPQNAFSAIQVQKTGGGLVTYEESQATYYPIGSTSVGGQPCPATDGPCWLWNDPNADFATGVITVINPASPAPPPPPGNGDITDPEAWTDLNGHIPPDEYSNVPYNVNFPLNGDGRYWFAVNASTIDTNSPISFIGSASYYTGSINLQWSVVQEANDGSGAVLSYSINSGATWTTAALLPQTQLEGIQNGQIVVPLAGATGLQVQVTPSGGIATTGSVQSQVAIAITRNANEGLSWDNPNPFNPINYNALITDNVVPTATMSSLQYRMAVRLGFANQANNLPPGMPALIQDFLTGAQTYLYKRYVQLHTKRMFRWKINPGQRFYSLKDNDENVLEGANLDPTKTIDWVGIQDSRNVWYPMIQGIPPQLFTMITKPWRPARYQIRNAIEIYPAPDQTYWLWVYGHFGLMSFINLTDTTTIDSELVFLWALANAKAHYGQPDANNIATQANDYRKELVAGTHQTAHYLPGTIAVPPAVRPTLISFDNGTGAGA
jgi:hypothetical protein